MVQWRHPELGVAGSLSQIMEPIFNTQPQASAPLAPSCKIQVLGNFFCDPSCLEPLLGHMHSPLHCTELETSGLWACMGHSADFAKALCAMWTGCPL